MPQGPEQKYDAEHEVLRTERETVPMSLRENLVELQGMIGVDQAEVNKLVQNLDQTGYAWIVVYQENNNRLRFDDTVEFYKSNILDMGIGLHEGQQYKGGVLKKATSFAKEPPAPSHYNYDEPSYLLSKAMTGAYKK
ncbi:hypothetical protein KBC79_04840 [Candidatus Woesebacteria bacterium]|nr:hypothetical protein [Candidatus Woesebacteria bacterium]